VHEQLVGARLGRARAGRARMGRVRAVRAVAAVADRLSRGRRSRRRQLRRRSRGTCSRSSWRPHARSDAGADRDVASERPRPSASGPRGDRGRAAAVDVHPAHRRGARAAGLRTRDVDRRAGHPLPMATRRPPAIATSCRVRSLSTTSLVSKLGLIAVRWSSKQEVDHGRSSHTRDSLSRA
jgi:hypothetical protein